jgi:hypothetical protein
MSKNRIEIDGIAYTISTWGDDSGVAVWRKIGPFYRSDGRVVSSHWKQCGDRETAIVRRHFLASRK